ncbi:MAG: glutamate dehydrogenase [Bacteroidota bacterium]
MQAIKLNYKHLIVVFVFFLGVENGFCQFRFTNEIGAVVGPVAFQSDFGERNDFETNSGNTGFGIGLIHYMNFTYLKRASSRTRRTFFNQHFKIRNELSFNTTQLNHFGKWVDEARRSEGAEKLRRHSGSATNFNIGSQLEFHLKNIKEFESMEFAIMPYISLGLQYTIFSPTVETSFGTGSINDQNNFFDSWVNATNPNFAEDSFLFDGISSTLSVTGSVGARYKLTILSDLVFDLKWQYFLDDRVDGLNHNLASNKSNDWLVWLNVGYVHYLDNN